MNMLPTPQTNRLPRRNRLYSAPARVETNENEHKLENSTKLLKNLTHKRSEQCLNSEEKNYFAEFEHLGLKTPIESEKYKCKTCDKKFFHLNALKAHEMVHSTTEVYSPPAIKCFNCNKKFSSKLKLTIHSDKFHSEGTRILAVL